MAAVKAQGIFIILICCYSILLNSCWYIRKLIETISNCDKTWQDCGHLWTSLDISGHLWTSLDISGLSLWLLWLFWFRFWLLALGLCPVLCFQTVRSGKGSLKALLFGVSVTRCDPSLQLIDDLGVGESHLAIQVTLCDSKHFDKTMKSGWKWMKMDENGLKWMRQLGIYGIWEDATESDLWLVEGIEVISERRFGSFWHCFMASCHASATDLRMPQIGQWKTCKSIRMPQGTSDFRDQIFHSKAFCLQRPPLPQFTTISIAVQMPLPWSLLRDQIFIEASASCCVLHISSFHHISSHFITFHDISSHFIIFHRSSICYDFPHFNRTSTSPIPSCNTVASMILDVGKRQEGFHMKFGKDMDKRIISWYILNLNVGHATIVKYCKQRPLAPAQNVSVLIRCWCPTLIWIHCP